jgi:hypothetical protein
VSKVNAVFGVVGLVGFTSLIASLLMAGCSAKVDIKSTDTAVSAAASAAVPDPEVPIPEALSSILRVSDRIIQVCYNGKNDKGRFIFLLQYKPSADDDFGVGWRYVDDQTFLQTDAGKWYTQAPNRAEYNAVYPDVTGLQCKQQ